MRRLALCLGLVVPACANSTVEEPPTPEVELPLAPDDPGAVLPSNLLALPDEVGATANGVEAAPDPARASRSVRYIANTQQVIELEDEPVAAQLGDLTLPASRGMELDVDRVADVVSRVQPVIFGSDNRVSVGSTLEWPARSVTKLFVSWKNGQGGGCTGTLVGRRSVITAGHCVYNPDKGGWAASITAVP